MFHSPNSLSGFRLTFAAAGLMLAIGTPLRAESLSSTFPAARFFPDPVGILFPGFNVAAGVNAASIPVNGKGTALQGAFSPTLSQGADPTQYFGSLATAKSGYGIGLGYLGSSFAGTQTNGVMGGAGYAFEAFSLGLGLRDSDIKASGFNPEVDASIMFLSLKDFIAGAVFYHINGSAQLDVGIGAKSGKKYNLEVNLLLPPFSDMSGGYTATASSAIYTGIFGLHFRVSYYTAGTDHFSETFGLGAWLTENVNLIAQFSTVRRATIALTVAF